MPEVGHVKVSIKFLFSSSEQSHIQISPYPTGPHGLCKVCEAEIMFGQRNINLRQKLPLPQDFTKSMFDSCPNHLFPTSPTEWEFKLANLTGQKHRETVKLKLPEISPL